VHYSQEEEIMSPENEVVSQGNQESKPDGAGKAIAIGAGVGVGLLVIIPIILVLCAIVVIAILLLMGPVVGNTFSNIVENLDITPTPY
jgi:hypothetical protein